MPGPDHACASRVTQDFDVRLEGEAGAVARLVAVGELDAATTQVLADAVRGALLKLVREVVIDIRGLTFCDAAGLRALTTIDTAVRLRGARLVLHGPCPAIELLLDLTGTELAIRSPRAHRAQQ